MDNLVMYADVHVNAHPIQTHDQAKEREMEMINTDIPFRTAGLPKKGKVKAR